MPTSKAAGTQRSALAKSTTIPLYGKTPVFLPYLQGYVHKLPVALMRACLSHSLRPGEIQGLGKSMVNHPIRMPISHQTLLEKHCSMFRAACSFQQDALRVVGLVTVVGSPQRVPLWICVEWDSKTILVGYHWQGGNGYLRPQLGLEQWFRAAGLVDAKLGDRDLRLNYFPSQDCVSIHEEVRIQDHNTIVDVTAKCQAALDSVETVTASLKDAIRHAMKTGDTRNLSAWGS